MHVLTLDIERRSSPVKDSELVPKGMGDAHLSVAVTTSFLGHLELWQGLRIVKLIFEKLHLAQVRCQRIQVSPTIVI